MYKNHLDDLLKKGYNLKSILLYGEEPYFIKNYGEKIADLIDPNKEGRVAYYYDEYNYESAKKYLSQSSLFGDINLLIIKHDKALPKKEIDNLIELCNKNSNSYLIYELYSKDAKRVLKSFEKKGSDSVRFFKPKLYEAKNIILEYAKKKSINIDEFSITHLLLTMDLNIELSLNELEKISIKTDKVSNKDIDELSFPLNPLTLENIYIELLNKKPINKILSKIKDHNIEEIRIITGLQKFLQQIFMIYSYIKLYGAFDSFKVLGYRLPKEIEKERVSLAIKFNEKKFLEFFDILQESELYLKTKREIDKKSYLFSSLIKIQALI